jgi:hypothetical protein
MNKWSTKIAVALFGLVFFGLGAYLISQSYLAARSGIDAVGKVVDIRTSRSSKGGVTYSPVIEFVSRDGQTHRFTSGYSSSWRPEIGKSEPVIYDPARPEDAIEKSAFQMYVFPGIFAAVGLLVLFLGLALPPLISSRHRMKEQRLRSMGRQVQARITGAAKTGFEVNHQPYYAVTAQWLDPTTNTVHIFKSFGMPYDPSQALQGKQEVTVYVNPSNPKDYWMDTTFLPTVAQ